MRCRCGFGALVAALAMLGAMLPGGQARAAGWASFGLGACVAVAPGEATVLYNTPRLMQQQEIGTLPPGDLYRIAGLSTRYRLLRATAHAPGYKPGQIVGWVWSVRLKPQPPAACD